MLDIISNVFDFLLGTLQDLVNLPFGVVEGLSSALGL